VRTPQPDTPPVLDLTTITRAVTLPDAVTAVEDAFRALAQRTVLQPPPTGLDLPGGEVHVKSAQLGPHQPVVVKIASGFGGNPQRGLPAGDGVIVVLDPDTGQLRAVLLDHGWLTDVRTAAATAVAARHLAGPLPQERLAVLGTGVQADLTLRTLGAVGLLPGEVAASRLHKAGKRLAVIEAELIGGECGYWACIPSKTLLRAPEADTEATRAQGVASAGLNWAELRDYRAGTSQEHPELGERTMHRDLRVLVRLGGAGGGRRSDAARSRASTRGRRRSAARGRAGPSSRSSSCT